MFFDGFNIKICKCFMFYAFIAVRKTILLPFINKSQEMKNPIFVNRICFVGLMK